MWTFIEKSRIFFIYLATSKQLLITEFCFAEIAFHVCDLEHLSQKEEGYIVIKI